MLCPEQLLTVRMMLNFNYEMEPNAHSPLRLHCGCRKRHCSEVVY